MKIKAKTVDRFVKGNLSCGITMQTLIIEDGAQIQDHFEIRLYPVAIHAQLNRKISFQFGFTLFKIYVSLIFGRILRK